MFARVFSGETKPESDNDNYYIRYFSLDLFSWTNLIYKINLSNFNPKDIENRVPIQEYEKVLNHIRLTTKRLRRFAEFTLYLWLIIAFSPLTNYLRETEFTLAVITSYALSSLIIVCPVLLYMVVYGQRENLKVKTQLALTELNDREYNHKGVNWNLTEDGKYIHLQMNFSHYRHQRFNQVNQATSNYTPIEETPLGKLTEIEIPELFTESERSILDVIRGRKSKSLTKPLIKV